MESSRARAEAEEEKALSDKNATGVCGDKRSGSVLGCEPVSLKQRCN